MFWCLSFKPDQDEAGGSHNRLRSFFEDRHSKNSSKTFSEKDFGEKVDFALRIKNQKDLKKIQ